jgi:arylsulfatase A-like enzyme
MIDAERVSDGLLNFSDLLPTALTLAGAADRLPTDRYVDGVDQTSFLLAPDGASCRKYHYYWLIDTFSALRVGEYNTWMLSSTSDDATDVHGAGGFTGVLQRYTYPRLFNLYLDPKEAHSYLTRKLAYLEVLREGMRAHLATFQAYPPKRVMGLRAPAPDRPPA